MMPKVPKEFCIDSFMYKEYMGINSWSEPIYAEPISINYCRIDRGAEYTSTKNGRQLLYNAVVFCYTDITEPMKEFKTQSVINFDGLDHIITKVIPMYEAYENTLYSYELEVI